ncbi:MAG: hypothetical protein GWN07_11815 [Actinobacteria bacterium]|nr:LytTR family transcriptional regulator [Actinomycetota bacterium]NIX20471.1 hypothetical protein [Actinomycetota bacterium]
MEAANAAESAERNGDAVLASDRIALKLGGRTELVDLDEIYWIEGADVYVRVHTGERSFLVREKLETLERELNPTRFLRVHRSAIVNFDRVARIQRDDRSRHEVVLEDGSRVRVSRSGKRVLDHHLNGSG